ncbi:MAG: hypothetical protein KUG77_24955 [Nannocystaceae bacterium]|nr:hypothetical protein [Nannocystaceae bacterium]
MSRGSDRDADTERVRSTVLHELKVHVRLADQGHKPTGAQLEALASAIPPLSAFSDHRFRSVRVVLDWDHQLPSQFMLLRVFASYDDASDQHVQRILNSRDVEIGESNLYPEFDVPDYAEIEGSETYVGVLKPGTTTFEDFRFLSGWRKQVEPFVADAAVRCVRAYEGYQRAAASRASEGLGGPVIIGWAPPCLAETEEWAIEIWLLTEFDGQTGKARVFMVDPTNEKVTREFNTDVQLA